MKLADSHDQEILRSLSNLAPDDCLDQIAEQLRTQLNCETACILIWRETPQANGQGALITEHDHGMPLQVKNRPTGELDLRRLKAYSEIYGYGEGITGGYIFEKQNIIRARIDWSPNSVYDDEADKEVVLEDTNWHNMAEFKKVSLHHDFRSLLGLPLDIKNQQIGVVKLINKRDEFGKLSSSGFSPEDLERARTYLSKIEQVIETKANEQQLNDLFDISQNVISADFDYYKLLEQIATNCARALNLRACIIRMFDHKELIIRGNSLGLEQNKDFEKFDLAVKVAATRQKIEFAGNQFRATNGTEIYPDLVLPELLSANTKSILAVPVIYQEKVIGVIECYTFLPRTFSRQQAGAVLAYGTLIGALFQRYRITEAIDALTEPFSLLSSIDGVFSSVVQRIERYLDTQTVSIWEQKATSTGFEFKLAKGSPEFEKNYREHNILTLSETSFTGRIAKTNELEHLDQPLLEKELLEHREFIDENELKSLTIVPISIGTHVNAVIDVFYTEDKMLLKEDRSFLRLLAGKAAAALWSKKLMMSFQEMSKLLWSAPNLEHMLDSIAYLPREVLYADLVIVFPYDFRQQQFLPPRWSGEPREKIGVFAGEKEKDKDFVNLMLNVERNPLYLSSTQQYKEFCQNKGTLRPWTESDFWHREGVQSMAAVRLEDRRQRPVGVMFFNYRTPFDFDVLTRQVIDSFAWQASLAFVNASFKGTRIQELVTERTTVEHLNKLERSLSQLDVQLSLLQFPDDDAPIPREQYYRDATSAHLALTEIYTDVSHWRTQLLSESAEGDHEIEYLISDSLDYLAGRLEGLSVIPHCDYAKDCPSLWCHPKRIEGLLIQLLSLLLDASRSLSPSLSIKTLYHKVSNTIEIHLALAGGRVSDEHLDRILKNPMPSVGKMVERFAFCEALAFFNEGEVELRPNSDGLFWLLRLRLD
jgi:transcriptional regulator with GAF, ATPase, and Fis domain